jgi:hypothetical protein
LSPRELAIVASAALDVALAELLSRRLTGPQNEIGEFLGVAEDGRAPAGSFGARIQLARLLGLIGDKDVAALRAMKNLRNKMAHRARMDFTHELVAPFFMRLWAGIEEYMRSRVVDWLMEFAKNLQAEPEAETPAATDEILKELAWLRQHLRNMNETQRAISEATGDAFDFAAFLHEHRNEMAEQIVGGMRQAVEKADPDSRAELLLFVFAHYQERFYALHQSIQRVDDISGVVISPPASPP